MPAGIDVAAGQHRDDRPARRYLAGQQRGDADRSRALDGFALVFLGMADAGSDLLFAEQHHAVEEVPAHLERQAVVKTDAAAERIGER